MTTSQSDAPWLTQEAYDRLSKELEYISGPGRQEICLLYTSDAADE